MRRHLLAVLVALLVVAGGCSDDSSDGDDADGTSTTAAETTEAGPTTTAAEAEDAEVDCEAFATVVDLLGRSDEIATGSNEGQVAADEALAGAVDALRPSAEGDALITESLDTLGQVSFQVTDSAEGPSADEVDAALVAIEDAWSGPCSPGAGAEPTTTTAPAG